jgi:hypothetical protein
MNIIIILLVIVLFAWTTWYIKKTNHIHDGSTEGFLNTFNGRLALDDQYFYDTLFDNTFYYENDDPFSKDMVTGWEKCKTENTAGNCVEFGLTGYTYAFAPIGQ